MYKSLTSPDDSEGFKYSAILYNIAEKKKQEQKKDRLEKLQQNNRMFPNTETYYIPGITPNPTDKTKKTEPPKTYTVIKKIEAKIKLPKAIEFGHKNAIGCWEKFHS